MKFQVNQIYREIVISNQKQILLKQLAYKIGLLSDV